MDEHITFMQFVISLIVVVVGTVFTVLKYIDRRVEKDKEDLKIKVANDKADLQKEINKIQNNQNETVQELRKISDCIIELRTLLFGASGHGGILNVPSPEKTD